MPSDIVSAETPKKRHLTDICFHEKVHTFIEILNNTDAIFSLVHFSFFFSATLHYPTTFHCHLFITGPPNGPVLFCSLASVVVIVFRRRLSGSVTLPM